MKKLFTIFAIAALFFATQGAFARHHARYFDTEQHHDIYHQTLEQNGGYKGAQTQAAGGLAKQMRGGFIGDDNPSFTSVMNAKKMGDDSYVTLKGKIVSKIGKEKYLFKDNTGTIEIEIDDDNWNGVQAGSKDIQRFVGAGATYICSDKQKDSGDKATR